MNPLNSLPQAHASLPPHLELRSQSKRIQELIVRGFTSGNASLIHDAGKLLETFSAYGSQQRLYAPMAAELSDINNQIPYDRILDSIQNGLTSSESLCALFEYIAPPFSMINAFIVSAPDAVPIALEAIIRNGWVNDYEVNDLIQDLHALPDNRALAVLMAYKLDRYRTGGTEDLNVPELISEYFLETKMPATLEDAGELGKFLMRELSTLVEIAEQNGSSGYLDPAYLFSLETLEMLAACGFAAEVARMAVFYLDTELTGVRSRSRLARIVPSEIVAERTFEIIGTLRRVTTAHLNFFLESPLISTEQFFKILSVGDTRLNATGIMNALGWAFSIYDRMDQANRELLIEKSSFAIDRFVELISSYSQGIRKELVNGLGNVYLRYNRLDQAGKTMLEEKTLWAIDHCMAAMEKTPQQKQILQQEIISLKHLPRAVWESTEWMQAQILEKDLGL